MKDLIPVRVFEIVFNDIFNSLLQYRFLHNRLIIRLQCCAEENDKKGKFIEEGNL